MKAFTQKITKYWDVLVGQIIIGEFDVLITVQLLHTIALTNHRSSNLIEMYLSQTTISRR